jgi:hypothetical protein
MTRLKCSFKASESLKLDSLDFSSDDLLLVFCEVTDVVDKIVHFKVINEVLV